MALRGPAVGMILLILDDRGVRLLLLLAFPFALGFDWKARASRSRRLSRLFKLIEVAIGLVVVFVGEGILADRRGRRVRSSMTLREARSQHYGI